jgi:hypothetical protein
MMKTMGLVLAVLLVSAVSAYSAENTLMHCFAFTPNQGAAQSDWDAFAKATNELPGKIDGLQRVWYGKLRAPLPQFNPASAVRKQALQSGKGTGDFDAFQRTHGVCMEFRNMEAFQKYGAKDNTAHNQWTDVYNKVKQGGTTTYQIVPMQ